MPRDGAIIFSDLTGTKKPPPTAEGGDLVQALGRPPYCGSSTGKLFMPLGSATEMPVTGAGAQHE